MSLNTKKLKKIRRFGRLRFYGDVRYNEKVMFAIYEKADDDKRKQLDQEMDDYFEAISGGRLKPGESMLKLAFPEESKSGDDKDTGSHLT